MRVIAVILIVAVAAVACVTHLWPDSVSAVWYTVRTGSTSIRCVSVSQRANSEAGCWIVADQSVGRPGKSPWYWHVDTFDSQAAAERAKGPTSTVVQAFDRTWLLTIDAEDWRAQGGEHAASIGPLPVTPGREHMAQYLEAVMSPGTKSVVHRHSGPEAWYTLAGETCLETPTGSLVGRPGGPYAVVPGSIPMELTATGRTKRQALALILHDASQEASSFAFWAPKGLCK
jgi:hypothetical protein